MISMNVFDIWQLSVIDIIINSMGNDNARGEKPLEKTDDDIKINH